MSDDDDVGGRMFVSLPSERFHTTPDALTKGEWQRRHGITYQAAEDVTEDDVA